MYPPFVTGNAAVGLALLRLVAGAAFMVHGWGKIHSPGGPLGWMGEASDVPGIMQALAAYAEFGGGVAWVIGLLTPIACVGIICTMVTALTTVHLPRADPFVATQANQPSYELALLYLVIGLILLLAGPGMISIDGLIFGRPPRPTAPAVPPATPPGPSPPTA
jgi:putative oxidoreductase